MTAASDFLRNIHESGRDATDEEVNQAVRMERQSQGVSDEGLNLNSKFNPYYKPPRGAAGKNRAAYSDVLQLREDNLAKAQADDESLRAAAAAMGVDTPSADLPTTQASSSVLRDLPTYITNPLPVSSNHAIQRAQIDSIIKGNTDTMVEATVQYAQGVDTVQDEMITYLEKQYSDEFVDQEVLKDLYDKPQEEQLARIMSEFNRLDAQKEHVRNLLALNMMRQGMGQYPVKALDQMYAQLQPIQIQRLYDQRRTQQVAELNQIVDRIAADQAFTAGEGLGEIVQQDILPFWGASTRILGTNKFLPDDVEMSVLRKGFPGEVRQEIREWWVGASHEDRVAWLKDLEKTWQDIRKGPNSGVYTRYLVIENLIGTFTDELLYADNPTDSFDRVMGNLDTALGMLVATGLVMKRGKSIFDIFTGGKTSTAKQVAAAGGSRIASEALDESLVVLARELGLSTDEASVPMLPRPKQMEMDYGLDVETDTIKHTTTANAERRKRILEWTDDAEITLLDSAAKVDAVRKQLDELANNDTVHVHHKMSSIEGLPNGTGVAIRATVGPRGGEGWMDLTALMDDMAEMDPYQQFRIVRRNKEGKLEELDISWQEIVDYYSTGRIPAAMDEFLDVNTLPDIVRHFGMRSLRKISNEELEAALGNGWLDPASDAYRRVRAELNNRASKVGSTEDPLLLVDGEELFVQFDTKHFFDAKDMQNVEGMRWWDIPFVQSAVSFTGRLFPPNTVFGKLYEAARQSYHMEEAALQEFADILVKFDNLPTKKKREVAEMLEWAEDYAKDMYEETGIARAPTTSELIGEFSHFSDETFEGYLAHKEAMEGLYDVFNRRLYREFNNKRYKTMRGTDDSLPSYHGEPMRDMDPGTYYDPIKRELVKLDAEQISGIVEEGGGAIKLEFPIDTPSGQKTTRILARKGEYEIGDLSTSPLAKYEGYQFRFYEDPYYIVKRTYGATVDGKKMADDEFIEEAIRTAPTHRAARSYLGEKMHDNGKGEYAPLGDGGNTTFVIQPGRQLNQTEGTLYQKQSLQGQGRLFWDERSHERLPDVDGNRAKVTDPFQAMQKGMAMALRQSTQEGLFDALKVGFKNEFGDLPKMAEHGGLLEMEELRDLERALTEGVRESTANTKRRYKEARAYVRYMRTQLGTDTAAVPALRAYALSTIQWLDNYVLQGKARGLTSRLERGAMSMDPFARGRKIAYGAFMVLRPARQFALQSMQVSMLIGLAPGYIGTGRVFLDGMALRRGLAKARRAGVDDGWSDSKLAKVMGLSTKEYKRLVEEFQRSGLLGSVNTHAFNASGRNLRAALDPNAGPAGRMMYNFRARGRQVFNAFARGFEWGEMSNLTSTYLVALRRAKKKFKVDDLTKFNREQWQWITAEADGLALGMTRPNKFGYQSGATGLMFQFMSFQHRALLTMVGMNPRLSAKETAGLVLGNYILWGSNIFGGEEYVREFLAQNGLSAWGQQEIMPGQTVQDVLVAGFIETALNGLLNSINDVEQDLNIGILAPGAAIAELYKGFYDLLTSAPTELEMLGPFSNQASGFIKGAMFTMAIKENQFKSPSQKIVESAEFFSKAILPQFNDIQTSWISAQVGEWVDKSKDPLGIQPSKAALIARGLFGIRPEAETSLYRARRIMWENEQNIDDWVRLWRPYVRQAVDKWSEGEYSDEQAYQLVSVIHGLTEDAPEGVRQEIYKRIMSDKGRDGKSITEVIAELGSKATSNIRKLEPHINNSQLTPEQRKSMKEFIDYVAEGYVGADEQYRQMIQQELDAEKGKE